MQSTVPIIYPLHHQIDTPRQTISGIYAVFFAVVAISVAGFALAFVSIAFNHKTTQTKLLRQPPQSSFTRSVFLQKP
ncbi:hypothetical protein [Rheinheimera sp. KL1]|uniref:hypothetical protein n=1 Tax=Rheinheimera sp. KL1 TaxID=1635005 RepID=UPI00256EA1FB|nr:hypothetical protein [Rheinheimera sp. KL1]